MKEKTTMIIAGFLALVLAQPAFAQEVKLEKIEWTDIWVMNAKETENPRVLLVGDSIVKGYYGAVEQGLSGQAACARYATSLFLSNPDYLAELTLLIKRYDFDVIHINNGLHGWDYSEEEYRQGLYSLLALMEREAPRAKIVWAMTTRMDPVRDTMLIEHTPIDYLDFASPVSGLGGKMGMDATNKWPGETQREWGSTISMDAAVQARMDGLFDTLGL